MYAIVSVAMVLFLFGLFALVAFYARQMIQQSKESINIMVEVKEESTEDERDNLLKFIQYQAFVKEGSIKYTTKAEAAEEMKSELGDFSKYGFENPFHDVIHFNVLARYMESQNLEKIKNKLLTHKAVYNVYYQEAAIIAIEKNVRKVGFVMLALGLLFMLVAITLIHNTIRLALYANRFLIKNMQLVGASWSFISAPYLWKSVRNGLLSALLAIGGLLLIALYANVDIAGLEASDTMWGLAVILGGIVLLGILISFSSTYYVVHKYLKMRVDDLY